MFDGSHRTIEKCKRQDTIRNRRKYIRGEVALFTAQESSAEWRSFVRTSRFSVKRVKSFSIVGASDRASWTSKLVELGVFGEISSAFYRTTNLRVTRATLGVAVVMITTLGQVI
jgi:hypothetical protein